MPRSLTNILLLSLAGLSSLLLFSAFADEHRAHKASPAQQSGYTEPGLWKIADADTTIYLFGTVHILSKDIEWRGEKFDTAWDEASVVYFETDTSPKAQAGIQSLVFKLGMNEQGITLS